MALLTKKEFADRCGMPTKSLAVYAMNGKIIYTDKERVNDQVEPNKSFLVKYSRKAAAKRGEATAKDTPRHPATEDEDLETDEITEYSNLETEKLKLQVEKLRNENAKLRLGNEKTVGNFIQTDTAKTVVIQLSESIHLSWENEIDDILMKLAAKFGLTRDEIAELRKEKVNSTNVSRQRAVNTAKNTMRRLAMEAGNKKGIGEHD